jgi:serine protease Do
MVGRILLILLGVFVTAAVFIYFRPSVTEQPQSGDTSALTADALRNGVVSVWSSADGKPITQGSGFVVSNDGLIITSRHVLTGGDTVKVRFDSSISKADFNATIVMMNDEFDLALLRIEADRLQPIPLTPDKAKQGHPVWALGFPSTEGLDATRMTITSGIVSRINPDDKGVPLVIQTDAYFTYGSSGGPLYDLESGGVIGVCTWAQYNEEKMPLAGVNYAVSIEKAMDIFQEYIK